MIFSCFIANHKNKTSNEMNFNWLRIAMSYCRCLIVIVSFVEIALWSPKSPIMRLDDNETATFAPLLRQENQLVLLLALLKKSRSKMSSKTKKLIFTLSAMKVACKKIHFFWRCEKLFISHRRHDWWTAWGRNSTVHFMATWSRHQVVAGKSFSIKNFFFVRETKKLYN